MTTRTRKRTKVSLLGGAADSAVKELLKDKETRDLIRSGAQTTIQTGASVVKFGITAIASLAALGLIIWGAGKISDKMEAAKLELQEGKLRNTLLQEASGNLKHSDTWFDSRIVELRSAMDVSKGFNKWGVSYEKSKIVSVLKSLETPEEWVYMVERFGKVKDHRLTDWLGCDGNYDIGDYNDILSKLGVSDDLYMIKPISIFSGTAGII